MIAEPGHHASHYHFVLVEGDDDTRRMLALMIGAIEPRNDEVPNVSGILRYW